MGDRPKEPETGEKSKKRYEAPQIAWEEPFEPVGFGMSCAKQEGNPGCFPGPILT